MYYTKNIIKTERWPKERKINIVKKWKKSWLILPGGKFCGFVWEKLVLWCCKDCVEFSFSNKSAKPLDDSSHGSKPIEINNISLSNSTKHRIKHLQSSTLVSLVIVPTNFFFSLHHEAANYQPRSSSWLSRDLELNPNAACQSSQLETGIESAISVVGTSGTSVTKQPFLSKIEQPI